MAICVAVAKAQVPNWAKEAVWYQIFPERFRNGDPRNDPTAKDGQVSGGEWQVSPWTSDWYKLQPWEKKRSNNFYDVVFDRRYGGDLEGIIEELPYLKTLGVNAIYLNPVFESPSLHKYNTATYIHVDHNFGPDPAGDLKIMSEENPADPATWKWTFADKELLKLVKRIHEMGMRVIFDGVFNHVGTDFWAFKDVERNQKKSKYKDWFVVKSWDDSTKGTKFDYVGWWGVRSLPVFRKDTITGLVHGPYEHVMAITKRWLAPDGNPANGIDGWRLDVPNEVPHPFWKDWRILVKSVNPEAYIVGEIWDDGAPWLKGDEFDAVMNYQLAKAVMKFFIDKKMSVGPSQFDSTLRAIRNSYPDSVDYVLQNLVDSHDTDRLGSMIMNPDREYNSDDSPRNNPRYDVSKPDAAAIQSQELIVLFQMTYVGAPMVYYGDEAGMWGGTDPDERKPMLWPDLNYEDERGLSLPGGKREGARNVFNQELFNFYRTMIHERESNPSLTIGSYKTLIADDQKKVFVFERKYGSREAIVGFNLSGNKQTIALALQQGINVYKDILNSRSFTTENGSLNVEIKPNWGVLLVNQSE